MRHSTASTIFLALVAGSCLQAASLIPVSDQELARRSSAIAVAEVRAVEMRRTGVLRVETFVQLEVAESIKGPFERGSIIELRELGGVSSEGPWTYVAGAPQYLLGERVLAFLRQRPDGSWFTSSMWLGKFAFERASDGREMLRRQDESGGQLRSAEEFLTALRGGGNIEVAASAASFAREIAPLAAPSAYTLRFDNGFPIRWRNFDSGGSLTFLTSGTQTGQSNTLGDTDAALAAWANAEPNDVNWSRGGTDATPDLLNDDGKNTIVFDLAALPNNGLCDGTLACAVAYGSGASHNHPVSGEQFFDISEADIFIQAQSLSPNLFLEILVHEGGHALGFRHSDAASPSTTSAVMASTIFGTYGTNLQDWDKAAIQAVYGPGAPCNPLSIETQPESITVQPGGLAALSVTVRGTDPVYQWYEGESGDLSRPISGANRSVFGTPAIFVETKYWVKVFNECSFVHSNTAVVSVCTGPSITKQPESQVATPGSRVTLTVEHTGNPPFSYQWFEGLAGDLSRPRANTTTNSFLTPVITASTSFWVRVADNCYFADSGTAFVTLGSECNRPSFKQQPASQPIPLGERATLTVVVEGTAPLSYQWYEGVAGNKTNPIQGATSPALVTPPISRNTSFWVEAFNACGRENSAAAMITVVCRPVEPPKISAPGQVLSGRDYLLTIEGDLGTTEHALHESTSSDFASFTTRTATGQNAQLEYQHSATSPTRFYYRAISKGCGGQSSNPSLPISVVIDPLPAPTDTNPHVTVSEGDEEPFSFQTFIPGSGGKSGLQTTNYSASSDKSWLTVNPPTGTVPPGGTNVTNTVNPTGLPTGTSTGTVTVTNTTTGQTISTTPVSVTIATPLTPVSRTTPPENALIFPVLAHSQGVGGAQYQSDIRLTNTSIQAIEYQFTFTASGVDGKALSYQTRMTLEPGETKALNDVLSSLFGQGTAPGENVLGILEVRPLNFAEPAGRLSTVGSSRTFSVSPTGTFGEFFPAIPFSQFLRAAMPGATRRTLSLQHIAQSDLFRTNFGILEAAGEAAAAVIRIFSAAGLKLDEFNLNLQPGEHQQLNQILAKRGISSDGARIEVEPTSLTGSLKVYASVLDQRTNDASLVLGASVPGTSASRYIFPEVRDSAVSGARVRTDLRLFNAAAAPVTVTLTFHPQGSPSTPSTAEVTINPSEVKAIDDALKTLFSVTERSGALHLTTPNDSILVGTARVYDDQPTGTLGQLVPAFVAAEGVGREDRPLQILQLEQSPRFRSDVGLVEVSGNRATVELSAFLPDSKVETRTTLELEPFQARTVSAVFSALQLGTVYNGRVVVRVTGGTGRILAYGTVEDLRTKDLTFIKGQ